MTDLIHPFPGNKLRRVNSWTDSAEQPKEIDREEELNLQEANVVTSEIKELSFLGNRHRPVLDIDLPCRLVESTTPGHFHLMIDKEMTWAEYKHLLQTLVDVGIVEENYVKAAVSRGYTAVRLPWIKKEQESK